MIKKQNFENWYNKNYKKILIIPAIILALSLIYIGIFYIQNNDIINKDVSLTGGTTITVSTDLSPSNLKQELSEFDFSVNSISGGAGQQQSLVFTVSNEQSQEFQNSLEQQLGFELTNENSSIEQTSSTLSGNFYKQLIVAVILAFFWMAAVVFLIFAKGKKIKFFVILLNLLFGIFLGTFFLNINIIFALLIFALFTIPLIYIYIKNSIPSFAVMLAAFADIVMTLAFVNFIGMKISTAGIVAFLMLIGYSVDTDILLTTRIVKRNQKTNPALFSAFKTGITMTLTSIIAIMAALIVVYKFESVLNQIFTILLIGLFFDLINTWLTNAGLIKWYTETK